MKLSKRLQAIGEMVPKHSIVADIGTDHGYIPVYLIESRISKRVIGSDISKNSLDKIIEYVKETGYEKEIESRLGNGLEVLKPYEVDTVIIAGMGGLLIRDILEDNKDVSNSITHFIFQPMIASKELRKYLHDNNFIILDEKIVKEENKYYEIIYAKKGKSYIEKDIYYEISKILIERKDPILQEFIENKIKMTENILVDLEGKDTDKSKERYFELIGKLNDLKEVLINFES
jgi:tRNA (adenine22-N1)-methyltransferase